MNGIHPAPAGKQHLLLAGGGHSHLAVLKRFAEKPLPNTRITLLSRSSKIIYTGMVPGLIAGHYHYHDCCIDLAALSQHAGAEFICTEITAVSANHQQLTTNNDQWLSYDLLSVNTGGVTPLPESADTDGFDLPTKPVEQLLHGIERLEQSIMKADRHNLTITVIGGGAGGVELMLALQYRLSKWQPASALSWQLITSSDDILGNHNYHVRQKLRSILSARGIKLITDERISSTKHEQLIGQGGRCYPSDFTLWASGVEPPAWIHTSGLNVDHKGFIDTNAFLQSTSHHNVFAAGDVAGSRRSALPKAGVFAVRQGKTLADNLQHYLTGNRLSNSRHSSKALALISTGRRHAVASRGRFYLTGKWLWFIKDWIDRRFIRRYSIPK